MLIGVVGKSNVGKSTFFKAMTLAEVEIANYPFATIKPNAGVGYIKIDCIDKEFNKQCNPREGYCLNHNRFVPVQLLDVAGLVPGAHTGLGLGLEFLNDLNQADALIHVIDISGSTNEKGEPIQALTHDPIQDVLFLEKELDYWYYNVLKKGWDKFSRSLQHTQESYRAIAKQVSGLRVTENMVKEAIKGLPSNPTEWSEENLLSIARKLRIESKPMIIAANKIDVSGAEKNLERVKKEFSYYQIIPCSAESELALKEAAKKNLIDYVPGESSFKIKGQVNEAQENGLKLIKERILDKYGSTGVQEVLNHLVLNMLKYKAVYPGGVNNLVDSKGNVLPDCFLLSEKATALDFAFRLHSDFGNNFIKAIDVKTKKPIGKDHELKHRDIIEIMTKK